MSPKCTESIQGFPTKAECGQLPQIRKISQFWGCVFLTCGSKGMVHLQRLSKLSAEIPVPSSITSKQLKPWPLRRISTMKMCWRFNTYCSCSCIERIVYQLSKCSTLLKRSFLQNLSSKTTGSVIFGSSWSEMQQQHEICWRVNDLKLSMAHSLNYTKKSALWLWNVFL